MFNCLKKIRLKNVIIFLLKMHLEFAAGSAADSGDLTEWQGDLYVTMRSCGLGCEYYIDSDPASYGQYESDWAQKFLVCPEHIFLYNGALLHPNAIYVHPRLLNTECCGFVTILLTQGGSLKKAREKLYTILYHQTCPWCDDIKTPEGKIQCPPDLMSDLTPLLENLEAEQAGA